jgi:hypothetical protein
MGLFGSSQTTDTTQTQTNTQTASNTAQNSAQTGGTSTPTMDPLFAMFQQSLVPAFGQAYANAQKDVYGVPQIAQNEQNANQTFNTGMDSATQALARRGALNSGAATSIASSLGAARAGNIANFNAEVPLLNQQNRQNATDQLLGLSSQFLNTVPKGMVTSGTSSGQSSGASNAFGVGSGTSNSTTNSNPSILSDVGGIAGLLSGIPGLSNMLKGMFGHGGPSYSSPGTPGGYQSDY